MAYEKRPGDGVLWANDRKSSDKSPDMTGDILGLDGKLYQLAAWRKEGTKGKPFYSLKLSVMQAGPAAPAPAADDDLPY